MIEDLIKRIQDLGSDADTLRDAAHEACHALDTNVPDGCWDRETVHKHVLETFPSPVEQVSEEVFARAVEWHVCDLMKEEYSPGKWATIAFIETLKNGGISTPIDFWKSAIQRVHSGDKSLAMATRIINL